MVYYHEPVAKCSDKQWYPVLEDQVLSKAFLFSSISVRQLLAANAEAVAYHKKEYKNSGLVVILHC